MGGPKNSYDLYDLVDIAYVKNNKGRNITDQLTPFLNEHVKLRVVPKGGRIRAFGDPIENVYIGVYGEYCVISHTFHGQNNVIARRRAPQFLGISEVVNEFETYVVTMIALTECILIEIDKNYFLNELQKDGRLAIILIKNLTGKMSMQSRRFERLLYYDSADNLLVYIYQKWLEQKDHSDKVKITSKRTDMADEIGVNVRTLFRALNKVKAEGMINIERGKIIVTRNQINKIKERITSLI